MATPSSRLGGRLERAGRIGLLVVLSSALAGSAAAAAPSIQVKQSEAAVGDFVEVSGKGFAPKAPVVIKLGTASGAMVLGGGQATGKRQFHAFVIVPAVKRGFHRLIVSDRHGHSAAVRIKIVKPKPLAGSVFTGAEDDGPKGARLYQADGTPRFGVTPFPHGFTGGVRVAAGDVNDDGFSDVIVGAGPGGAPLVKVFSGKDRTTLGSFDAYDPAFTGGVFVAAGDVNGDGADDIVTGAGQGAQPHVKVFDGRTNAPIGSFFAYDPAFTGGVTVAAGDVNGDGLADVITGAGPGGAPHVKAFNLGTGGTIWSFLAYDAAFTGGVFVAAGDVNGDGKADIVTGPGQGGAPHVKVFDGASGMLDDSFLAFKVSFTGGVRVGAGKINRDKFAEVIAATGPGMPSLVKVFDGRTGNRNSSFGPYEKWDGGVFAAYRSP